MRTRLAAYRLNTGLTWLEVAQDILDSEVTDLWAINADEDPLEKNKPKRKKQKKSIKVDEGWPITQEALRKFVEGERKVEGGPLIPTTPRKKEKLIAIRDFLMHAGYLSKHEVEGHTTDFNAARALADFFRIGTRSANAPVLDGLDGEFRGISQRSDEIIESRLMLQISDDNQFLTIKETEAVYRDFTQLPFDKWRTAERRQNKKYSHHLSGWGVSGGPAMLLLFLKREGDEAEHHCYFATDFDSLDPGAHLMLIRYPAPLSLSKLLAGQENQSAAEFSASVDKALLSHFVTFERTIHISGD